MLRTHDDWERLVTAVLKKQQLWELFHAHSRSPSELSEASSSDLSSSSFREIKTSSAYRQRFKDAVARLGNWDQKFVLVSDFYPDFDVEDANLNSLKLLGTGTFCNTYAGDVSDRVKIVVKRLNKSVFEEEFKRSMDFVGSIKHENVVALRAYYCSGDEKLMMYDHYHQGSVYELLHGQTNEIPSQVSWETRLRIAIGAARGLASIHAQNGGTLVHGNIKSTNIFLNEENYGSISDLGMVNLIAAKFRKNEYCHAPEVENTRNVSQESDVYSFGILLFELLTRKPSVQVLGGPSPVDLVKLMKSMKNTNMNKYLLQYRTIREQMVRVLKIGISCVVKSMEKRPKISEVVTMLEALCVRNAAKRPGPVLFNSNKVIIFGMKNLLRAYANFLGKGTFASSSEGFYKAILKSGMVVTVKRMKDVNVTSREFKRHMDIVSRIRHQNCAILKAYYYFSRDEVLLVYDLFNHENLANLIYGKLGIIKPLSWEARFNLALTLAKGIAHIHGLDGSTLVHGSINSSNIFVDSHNNAIITDTALWKVRKPNSVLRRRFHLAPEVNDMRNVSQASDVYSFGFVLLELLMGVSPQNEERGNGDEFTSSAKQMLQLAVDCMEDAPEERPKMSAVVKRLRQIRRLSMHSDSEHVRTRLEDALEDQFSQSTI